MLSNDDLALGRKILDLPMRPNGSGESTVRGYLTALLRQVWREQEGFSGKRPFGDSGWQYDLEYTLVTQGILPGVLNDDDELQIVDTSEVDRLIDLAILSLASGPDVVSSLPRTSQPSPVS